MRSWTYWISGVVSTLLFLLFVASMLMVPGVLPSTKMWMLSVAGIGVAISLGVGAWRPSSTAAPAMLWPVGTMLGVVLLLELAYCAINVFLLATGAHL
ncbi:MAG: hypothetical protein ABI693_30455 [Bryobacteraceae bacterium]